MADRAELKSLFLLALRGRCHDDDNWLLKEWERWALALKACACILLRRQRPGTIDYYGDAVIVASFDHHEGWCDYGTSYSWQDILVPRSWRSWSYAVMWDGAP